MIDCPSYEISLAGTDIPPPEWVLHTQVQEEHCREWKAFPDAKVIVDERCFDIAGGGPEFITSYHGDHVRFCDLLRKRYGTTITATKDIAANLLTYGIYPCQLKWYDLPFTQIHIDKYIYHDQPFDWNGIPVLPIHTPGHCYAHTGFVIDWNGVRTATTGDTLQYGAGPIRVDMPVIYNDTAWPDRGFIKTFEQLLHHQTDLVLGGHSFSFFDDGILSDWHEAAKASYESAKQMIKDGDLLPAMTPPGFNELRIRSGENA